MWTKLFGSFRKEVNGESRAYAKEEQSPMELEKERKGEEQRRRTIANYQQDDEFQQMVKDTNETLEYLIDTNTLCNKCLFFLESPFERSDMVDSIVKNLEELKPKTQAFLKSAESETDIFQKYIKNTVTPYLKLSELLMGDDRDSKGIIDIAEESDSKKQQKLLLKSINRISKNKKQLRKMFVETKKAQIVEYFSYDYSGKIDFGKYTIDVLDEEYSIEKNPDK